MFCSHCGKKIAKGVKFCATCGHEVESSHDQPKRVAETSSDYSDTQTPNSVSDLTAKPKTSRKLLFGLGGVVLGAALLLLILVLSGVLTTARTYEGRGFATPEDAARAYLTGLKEQNLKKMISAFAIESLVDHYDFEALLLRLRVYVSDSFEIKLPDAGAFARDVNIMNRLARVSQTITNQYLYHNVSMIDLDEFMFLKSDEDTTRFIEDFKEYLQSYDFSDLKITGTVKPEELSDLYLNERNQENIGKQAKPYGVDKEQFTDVALTFTIGEHTWIFCPQLIQYNGRWYIAQLVGNLASLLDMDYNCGGMMPADELNINL